MTAEISKRFSEQTIGDHLLHVQKHLATFQMALESGQLPDDLSFLSDSISFYEKEIETYRGFDPTLSYLKVYQEILLSEGSIGGQSNGKH